LENAVLHRLLLTALPLTVVALVCASPAQALREAKGLSYPAISADGKTLYFTTEGDIWAAPVDGSLPARQLTTNVAFEGRAFPSPDGKQLAFLSDRYGGYDVFTIPADGGDWNRVTWGMATDYAYDWKPDGSALLGFTMRQDTWVNGLYEFSLDGQGNPKRISGLNEQRDNNYGRYLGSDATKIVYSRGPGDWARVRHRGSDNYDLYLYDTTKGTHTRLTTWDGNDFWPQPTPDGKTVYYVSERNGARNIWALDVANPNPRQLTQHMDPGVSFPRLSTDGDQLVYEFQGQVYLLDVKSGGQPRKLAISLSGDQKHEVRIDTDMPNGVDDYQLSPNGKYFAIVVMGDLYLLKNADVYAPDAKPDQDLSLAQKVAGTPGREMQPNWAPDSLSLAYISDRSGSFDVYIMDLTTLTERQVTNSPATEEWLPKFAPKGKKLAYYSGNRKLVLRDLESNQETQLVEGVLRQGPYELGYDWAPDGIWLSYSRATKESYTELFIMNTNDRKSYDISANAGFNVATSWSADGKWLAYTDYAKRGGQVMLLELNPEAAKYDTGLLFPDDIKKEEPPPAKPEGGAQPVPPAGATPPPSQPGGPGTTPSTPGAPGAPPTATPGAPAAPGQPAADPAKEEKVEPLKIDLRRIELRSRAVSGAAGNGGSPKFAPNGQYLVFEMTPANTQGMDEPPTTWWSYTIKEGQLNQLTQQPGLLDPQFAPDASKVYFRGKEDKTLGFVALQGPTAAGGGPVPVTSTVHLDQYEIWDQMLYEGWRHLRDSFYRAPSELGVDWDGVLARYRPRIRDISTTAEYNDLYRQMLGELGGSHLGFFSPGGTSEAPPESTADFGVWFDESYAGPGWKVTKVFNDGPADKPGSRLGVGDIILSVNGTAVSAQTNRDQLLRNLAGKPVTLSVQNGPEAGQDANEGTLPTDAGQMKTGATHEVVIKPTSWGGIRGLVYEQWVEDNRAAVDKLSGGKVGYQHIQGMDPPSLEKFRRELFSISYDKPGLIIDVRFNGGGNIHEDLVDLLDKRLFGLTANRGEGRTKQPALSYQGKIVVLMNPYSYSDAEIFPHIMQELGLARLVGEPTGGNVIGTYDFQLMDGSTLRLPSWGWWLLSGKDMEGNGAVPDVLVVFSPEQAAQGKDNQLEAAVAELQKTLGAEK
jgi:tricorn protease